MGWKPVLAQNGLSKRTTIELNILYLEKLLHGKGDGRQVRICGLVISGNHFLPSLSEVCGVGECKMGDKKEEKGGKHGEKGEHSKKMKKKVGEKQLRFCCSFWRLFLFNELTSRPVQ